MSPSGLQREDTDRGVWEGGDAANPACPTAEVTVLQPAPSRTGGPQHRPSVLASHRTLSAQLGKPGSRRLAGQGSGKHCTALGQELQHWEQCYPTETWAVLPALLRCWWLLWFGVLGPAEECTELMIIA